jgi:hypothetical protein
MPHPDSKTRRQPVWIALIAAILAALVGYFSPWFPHRAAGLAITGLDLSEYVKFVPRIASGDVDLVREVFLLPLIVASLSLTLVASRRRLAIWARTSLLIGSIVSALAMLPPAWTSSSLLTEEYLLQTVAIVACAGFPALLPLLRLLPSRLLRVILGLLSLGSLWPTSISFYLARSPIADLYTQPLGMGWGLWLWAAATLLQSVICVAELLRRGWQ